MHVPNARHRHQARRHFALAARDHELFQQRQNRLRELGILQERKDGSFQMFAATPSGRRIWVTWRYDREDDEIPDVFGEFGEVPIFVITAY